MRRKEVYSTFLEKLWRAVCARLLAELITKVHTGGIVSFGEAVVRDNGVTLTKHKWLASNERVDRNWSGVQVWSADGSFHIGASDDKKTYAALSYINVPNVHILEQAIRMAFKRGAENLSDMLQGD